MVDYPDAIYSPRTMANRDGVVYDAAKTKVIYAEDFNKDRDEIVAIETELGTDPKGAYADVAARLDYIEENMGGGGDPLDAYPVGAIYISVVSTSPATLFGGTWSAFGAGKVLVGLDSGDTDFDTVEETGGAKTHTLTSAESGVPAHTHALNTEVYIAGGSSQPSSKVVGNATTRTTQISAAANSTANASSAHNNVQPYIVVYMWKRTA